MNALFKTTFKGTLGELIAQTHLLAHGVQAAPSIKDSGNDLIAVRGHSFRAVQVCTSAKGSIHKPEAEKLYHILAAVHLPFDGDIPQVQQARVFLFRAEDVPKLAGTVDDHPDALLCFWNYGMIASLNGLTRRSPNHRPAGQPNGSEKFKGQKVGSNLQNTLYY